jgi:hypothetical protein
MCEDENDVLFDAVIEQVSSHNLLTEMGTVRFGSILTKMDEFRSLLRYVKQEKEIKKCLNSNDEVFIYFLVSPRQRNTSR